jgi:hypothetical protein
MKGTCALLSSRDVNIFNLCIDVYWLHISTSLLVIPRNSWLFLAKIHIICSYVA